MPERVVTLAGQVSRNANDKVERINAVTGRTKVLALNALIEAAHAGERGRGFAVVAKEVGSISDEIKKLSDALSSELAPQIAALDSLGHQLVRQVRGGRLADQSLNMIDMIDRNLYERSCDVRWWATDSAIVEACADPNETTCAYASKRLGVILDSYTVYVDLWVADRNGEVIASGRPSRYPHAVGSDVSREPWFTKALRTETGDDYAVDDVTANVNLDRAHVATYATAVRAGGESRGAVLGVLGIFFDWGPQAQAIVDSVRLTNDERDVTRCMLLDSSHRVIASTGGRGVLSEQYPLQADQASIGYYNDRNNNVVGYALTPGYETYAGLGWYGVIEQQPRRSPNGSEIHDR